MVKETLIVFDLSDVRAVRIRCEKCTETVVSTLNPAGPLIPQSCPWCGAFWREEQTQMQRMFMEALLGLRNQTSGAVRLLLELAGSAADAEEERR